MSDKELAPLEVLRDLTSGRLTASAAAELLGLERRRSAAPMRVRGSRGFARMVKFRMSLMESQAASEPPLTHDQRLRRCMICCCAVARNLAYHRARRESGGLAHRGEDFWNTADGNFIDAAVLAWCALFADDNVERGRFAEQGWRKLLPPDEHGDFVRSLLAAMGLSSAAFEDLIKVCRRYRDKFLAHLDSDRTMMIPGMVPALEGTRHLYNHIWACQIDPIRRGDALPDLNDVYERALNEGRRVYGS